MKLEVGQIWQVPKTLDVRTIELIVYRKFVWYSDIGTPDRRISVGAFKAWITQNEAKLIGHYDFKKRKAIPKK